MKNSDRQGWIIIGFVTFVFALLGALAVYATVTDKKIDPNTFCPSNGEYPVVRILIDKTDPWDTSGRGRLEKILREIKDNLIVNERISISVLDESGSETPTTVFDMCNPGRGDQANPLYNNPRRIHEKFETMFDRPLEEMLIDILKPGTAPRSPILEAIHNFPIARSNDRLVIISDLMQNSEKISFYRRSKGCFEPIDIHVLDGQKSHYGSITVYFIDRGSMSLERKECVIAFWEQHLIQMTQSLIFYKL